MSYSRVSLRIRQVIVFTLVILLFFFWLAPVSLLASLLSYEELKRATPWLVRLLDKSASLRAIVQNALPSTALILFNGLLPFLLESEWKSLFRIPASRMPTQKYPHSAILRRRL